MQAVKIEAGHYVMNGAEIFSIAPHAGCRWKIEIPGLGTAYAETLHEAKEYVQKNTCAPLKASERNEMMLLMKIAIDHVRDAAEADKQFAKIEANRGMHGNASEFEKTAEWRNHFADRLENFIQRTCKITG